MRRCALSMVLLFCAYVVSAQNGGFVVVSGDGIEFKNEQLAGKITICFYETYKTMEINQEAKKKLAEYLSGLNSVRLNEVRILGVTDCTEAKWPFVGMWKKGLVSVSEQIKQTIYGDWDGSMKNHFNLNVEHPHLIIFNSKGSIVYHNQSAINAEDENVLIRTLEDLFREQNL